MPELERPDIEIVDATTGERKLLHYVAYLEAKIAALEHELHDLAGKRREYMDLEKMMRELTESIHTNPFRNEHGPVILAALQQVQREAEERVRKQTAIEAWHWVTHGPEGYLKYFDLADPEVT